MQKFLTALVLSFCAVVGIGMGTALAQGIDDPIIDLARPVLDAIMAGEYWYGAALALVLAVAAFSRYAPWSWAKSSSAKVLTVFAFSFAGAFATGLAAGQAPSLAIAYTALKLAVVAAGGFSMFKALAVPFIERFLPSAPGWLKPFLNLALWAFRSSVKADEKAAKAGDDAVAADPADGLEGVLGEPTDVD